jgi:hypothetical protein
MKRIIQMLTLMAAFVAVLGISAFPASAAAPETGNAHFIKNATSSSLSGSSLKASFKETGLSSGSTETVTLNATESITYECVNGGGTNPAASNKKTFKTTGSTSGNFTADRSGNIEGSLSLSPASAESLGFSCPPGQTVTLVSVSYTNVSLTDSTSGATIQLANQSYTNPDAPPVKGK